LLLRLLFHRPCGAEDVNYSGIAFVSVRGT